MISAKETISKLVKSYNLSDKSIEYCKKYINEIKKLKYNFLFGIDFNKEEFTVFYNGEPIPFFVDDIKSYTLPKVIVNNNSDKDFDIKKEVIASKILNKNINVDYIVYYLSSDEMNELKKAAIDITLSLDWDTIKRSNFHSIPDSLFKKNKLIMFMESKFEKNQKLQEFFSMSKRYSKLPSCKGWIT